MKQVIIDCSKKPDDKAQQIIADIPADEVVKIQATWNAPVPQPSDIEVRLAALETKIGIQPQDIEAAKASLIAEPTQILSVKEG